MSMPYHNNLTRFDEVFHVPSGRRGNVVNQPRESATLVKVELAGGAKPRYFPIDDLRLIVRGVPEEVPPYDGEIPRWEKAPPAAAAQPDRSSIPGQFDEKAKLPVSSISPPPVDQRCEDALRCLAIAARMDPVALIARCTAELLRIRDPGEKKIALRLIGALATQAADEMA